MCFQDEVSIGKPSVKQWHSIVAVVALAATLFSQKINIHNLPAISSLFIGQEQSCMQLHEFIFT